MAEGFDVQIRVPREINAGDIIEVKAKIKHPSRTGLQLVETAATPFERFVRATPAEYVRLVEVFYGETQAAIFQMNAATSDNPLLSLQLRADQEAPLRVVVTNHLGESVEVTEDITFTAA